MLRSSSVDVTSSLYVIKFAKSFRFKNLLNIVISCAFHRINVRETVDGAIVGIFRAMKLPSTFST